MLILMGKTACGKDSVVKELIKGYGYKYLVPYTTRPPRINEMKGQDYNYISQRDFCKKIKHGFFIVWKTYETQFGKWYYGIAADDFYDADDMTVAIFTPDGLRDVYNLLFNDTVIYLTASETTLHHRLLARGDDLDEARRRLRTDREDFSEAEYLADYVVPNEHTSPEQAAYKIIKLLEDERDYTD